MPKIVGNAKRYSLLLKKSELEDLTALVRSRVIDFEREKRQCGADRVQVGDAANYWRQILKTLKGATKHAK